MLAGTKGTYLVKLDDVGVADLLEDLDFTGDALDIFLIVYFFFFEYFHGNLK